MVTALAGSGVVRARGVRARGDGRGRARIIDRLLNIFRSRYRSPLAHTRQIVLKPETKIGEAMAALAAKKVLSAPVIQETMESGGAMRMYL